MRPKVYKLQKFEIFWKTVTHWGVSNGTKMLSGQCLLLFSVTLAKNQQALSQLNMPKSTLKVLLEEQNFYPKILS